MPIQLWPHREITEPIGCTYRRASRALFAADADSSRGAAGGVTFEIALTLGEAAEML